MHIPRQLQIPKNFNIQNLPQIPEIQDLPQMPKCPPIPMLPQNNFINNNKPQLSLQTPHESQPITSNLNSRSSNKRKNILPNSQPSKKRKLNEDTSNDKKEEDDDDDNEDEDDDVDKDEDDENEHDDDEDNNNNNDQQIPIRNPRGRHSPKKKRKHQQKMKKQNKDHEDIEPRKRSKNKRTKKSNSKARKIKQKKEKTKTKRKTKKTRVTRKKKRKRNNDTDDDDDDNQNPTKKRKYNEIPNLEQIKKAIYICEQCVDSTQYTTKSGLQKHKKEKHELEQRFFCIWSQPKGNCPGGGTNDSGFSRQWTRNRHSKNCRWNPANVNKKIACVGRPKKSKKKRESKLTN